MVGGKFCWHQDPNAFDFQHDTIAFVPTGNTCVALMLLNDNRDQPKDVVVRHCQSALTSSTTPGMKLGRGDTMLAGNIRDRNAITVALQHQLRLHMFRPPAPARWTRHNINTPAVPFFGTVTSYVILYRIIHKNPP